MSAHEVVWRAALALTVVLALVGTLLAVPLVLCATTGFSLATFGAVLGLAFRPDLPGVRHPVLGGAAILLVPGPYPGPGRARRSCGAGVVGVLVLTSPRVTARIVRWSRGRLLPTETQLAANGWWRSRCGH